MRHQSHEGTKYIQRKWMNSRLVANESITSLLNLQLGLQSCGSKICHQGVGNQKATECIINRNHVLLMGTAARNQKYDTLLFEHVNHAFIPRAAIIADSGP